LLAPFWPPNHKIAVLTKVLGGIDYGALAKPQRLDRFTHIIEAISAQKPALLRLA
jgi:hypothetical protein